MNTNATKTTSVVSLKGTTLLVDNFELIFSQISEFNSKLNREIKLRKQTGQHLLSSSYFNLTDVKPAELALYRQNNVPSFVLKKDDTLYHSVIPMDLSSSTLKFSGEHHCANCLRLSAASDVKGGCAKVRELSTGIEKYPWITKGYEIFATNHDCFVVLDCSHYSKIPCSKRKT